MFGWFKKDPNIQKISVKTQEEVEYEISLIDESHRKLREKYSYTPMLYLQSQTHPETLYGILIKLSERNLMTLINDATTTTTISVRSAMDEWLKISTSQESYDIVDLFVLIKMLEVENKISTELSRMIYTSSINDNVSSEDMISNIALLLIELVSYIDACNEAAKVDENHSYTWKRYLASQFFDINFLKGRIQYLIDRENAKKQLNTDNFAGETLKLNNGEAYTGDEIVGEQVKHDELMKRARQNENKNFE